jgi:hypothetical protein
VTQWGLVVISIGIFISQTTFQHCNSISIAGVQQIQFAHADYYDSWGDFGNFFDVSADAANQMPQWWPQSTRSGTLM